MKKYLVTFYVVENEVWKAHFCYTIDSSELSENIQTFKSRGFRQREKNNIFIKTFSSDVDVMHMVYTVVELPVKL